MSIPRKRLLDKVAREIMDRYSNYKNPPESIKHLCNSKAESRKMYNLIRKLHKRQVDIDQKLIRKLDNAMLLEMPEYDCDYDLDLMETLQVNDMDRDGQYTLYYDQPEKMVRLYYRMPDGHPAVARYDA